jgi:hypothetical protein
MELAQLLEVFGGLRGGEGGLLGVEDPRDDRLHLPVEVGRAQELGVGQVFLDQALGAGLLLGDVRADVVELLVEQLTGDLEVGLGLGGFLVVLEQLLQLLDGAAVVGRARSSASRPAATSRKRPPAGGRTG